MTPDMTSCPICGSPLRHDPRYPRAVCRDCKTRAASKEGRRLLFGNVSMSGGFEAVYEDTGEPYPGHTCYIDGVECRADQAHFGGIVIEV